MALMQQRATGLTNNDAFIMRDGAVSKETNHPVVLSAA